MEKTRWTKAPGRRPIAIVSVRRAIAIFGGIGGLLIPVGIYIVKMLLCGRLEDQLQIRRRRQGKIFNCSFAVLRVLNLTRTLNLVQSGETVVRLDSLKFLRHVNRYLYLKFLNTSSVIPGKSTSSIV